MNGIIQCAVFCNTDFLVASRFIHVASCVRTGSFVWLCDVPLCAYPQLAYPLVCWWIFGLFLPLAIINNAALNILYKFLSEYMFSFFLDVYLVMEFLGHKITFILLLLQTMLKSTKLGGNIVCNCLNNFENWNLNKAHSKPTELGSPPGLSHFFPKQRGKLW